MLQAWEQVAVAEITMADPTAGITTRHSLRDMVERLRPSP